MLRDLSAGLMPATRSIRTLTLNRSLRIFSFLGLLYICREGDPVLAVSEDALLSIKDHSRVINIVVSVLTATLIFFIDFLTLICLLTISGKLIIIISDFSLDLMFALLTMFARVNLKVLISWVSWRLAHALSFCIRGFLDTSFGHI